MTSGEWVKRLSSLMHKHRPNEKGASFRNDYSAVVSEAIEEDVITKEDGDLLLKARNYLESWVGRKTPEPTEAYRQWLDVYDAGKGRLPSQVLEALLSRFPKSPKGRVDWSPFVLGSNDKRLISLLVTRRLIGAPDLRRIATARPSEFYRSAALDVLIDRKMPCPRPVWEGFSRGEGRPTSLLKPGDALVRSFAVDRKADATKWLLRFLAESLTARVPVLTSLLENADAAFRLSRYLAIEFSALGGVKRRPVQDKTADVLVDWLAVCWSTLEEGGSAAGVASVVLGLLRLAAVADKDGILARTLTAVPASSQSIEHAILAVLQQAESDSASSVRNLALVVRGDEMYRAVQEYLRRLPVGAAGMNSPERALRLERYLGRKEVIQGLLSALHDVGEEGPLRDAMEVALFNVGVRPYGDSGEETRFDPDAHETKTSGVLPGDRVIVTQSGRRLGGQEDGIVLVRAQVRPVGGVDNKERAV